MTEEEKTEKQEVKKLTKNFVVRCIVEHANEELEAEFMDNVVAYDQEDAKDFVTGWMAERGFIVKKWLMIGDIERLKDVAKNL